jgi:tRNA G10  N-methylase Trm11
MKCFNAVLGSLVLTSLCSSLLPLPQQQRFLVEFRGLYESFRVAELEDSLSYLLSTTPADAQAMVSGIEYVVRDSNFEGQPACGWLSLPNATIACAVANRCGALRSMVNVWGEGESPEEVCSAIMDNFDTTARAAFPEALTEEQRDANSWKIHFRRFGRVGRSGMDPEAKREFLASFSPVLKSLHGDVNLTHPSKQLLYLEDWVSFHSDHTRSPTDTLESFKPRKAIFGQIVAEGCEVQTVFDLRKRPFLGTTTMAPLPAHFTAVAARVGEGDTLLDPFCGTGSILIAAAHLGARVVGSDIDGDCLGLSEDRGSKNSRFKRYGMLNANNKKQSWRDQMGLSSVDNFQFYGLENRLVGLVGKDVKDLLEEAALPIDKFDAIATDPPYNRREKVMGLELDGDADSPTAANSVVTTLFQVARARLKRGGRLVFWYPSDAFVSEASVVEELDACLERAGSGAALELQRLMPEKLHDKLWRWLVVYTL